MLHYPLVPQTEAEPNFYQEINHSFKVRSEVF